MGMGGGYVPMITYDAYQYHNWRKSDKVGPVTTGANRVRGDTPFVICMGHDERSAKFIDNQMDPLSATDYKQPPIVKTNLVRRLTPLECERL